MAGGRAWTREEDALLLQHYDGRRGIAQVLVQKLPGRTTTSIINRARELRIAGKLGAATVTSLDVAALVPPEPPAFDPVAAWHELAERHAREVQAKQEAYEWLRPVELPAPSPPSTTATASRTTLIGGDFHFGTHDERSIALFLRCAEELQPERVILNGDLCDLLAVSRYPKDARRGFKWELRDEVRAFHEFLHALESVLPRESVILETEANHSGNGTASRWWRYLSDRCPELLGHAEAEERLSYVSWFYPRWSRLRLVPSVVIADDLLVLHGDIARKNGGYSARAHMERWQSSTLNSHTHRQGSSLRRIPAVGERAEAVQRAYEIGCLCDLSPSYASAPDWTNGFALVTHDEPAGDYAVELVTVSRGRCAVGALGKTLAA
jgi:hypothetical protein